MIAALTLSTRINPSAPRSAGRASPDDFAPRAVSRSRLSTIGCSGWFAAATNPRPNAPFRRAPIDGPQAGKVAVDPRIVGCDALDGEAPFERGARLGAIKFADALSRGDRLG